MQTMLINDSVVHEFDVVPWLAGGVVTSIEQDGDPKNGKTIVAGNPDIQAKLRNVLQAA